MYVYCISDESERYKLGFAEDVDRRLLELQTGNAERLTIVYRREVKNMRRAETSIHEVFAADRIRQDGEWFKIKNMALLMKIFGVLPITLQEQKMLESLGLR